MKKLGSLLFLLVCCFIAVVTYPMWQRPVETHVPILAPFLPQLATSPPALDPQPYASTATITLAPVPITIAGNGGGCAGCGLVAPTAPAPAAPVNPWSASDCSWAEGQMEWDHSLDANEVQAIENGDDPRFGPAQIPWYQMWAQRWDTVTGEVLGECHTAVIGMLNAHPIAASDVSNAQAWFAQAIQLHTTDLTTAPQNHAWDEEWIATYQKMVTMYNELPS